MIIKTLSKTRGITAFYDGSKYIIWSEAYGIVAESEWIKRTESQEYGRGEVEIRFDICNWLGYWDLQGIISRGITKMETEYVPKTVILHYHKIENEQNHLNRRLKIETEKM